MNRASAERRQFDALAPVVLAVLYVTLLLHTTADLGYARDEGFYFQASESYGRWLEALWSNPSAALQQAAIDRAFGVNHEHPPLMKLFVCALAPRVGQGVCHGGHELALSRHANGRCCDRPRVPLGSQIKGPVAGLGAAFGLAMMPRFFYHAHLACFDVPIVAMWLWAAYAYQAAQGEAGSARRLVAGLAFGLALDTKHNAWFLPFACGAHGRCWAAGCRQREASRALRNRSCERRGDGSARPRGVSRVVAVVGTTPRNRVRDYVAFHSGHEYYNMKFSA